MSAVADRLPLTETQTPETQTALAALIAESYERGTAVYPMGGGTSLDYGCSGARSGIAVSLAKLDRIIDYPARDMTITVEAGITMDQLAAALAAEKQWLPIDAPQPGAATLGGVIATAASGPRRYGYGTMRDYVIGISAVDGRGTPFKAGGRVVKNVAGYDFCKLLTGSLGTLGVITQVTLKIKPLPEKSAVVTCDLDNWDTAERALAALVTSATTPAAIELLAGPAWQGNTVLPTGGSDAVARLAVGLEGTASEVDWMVDELAREWRELGLAQVQPVVNSDAARLWTELREFPVAAEAPLVIKASVLPSRTTEFAKLILGIDPQALIQAHAGNGIVVARFARFEAGDVSRQLIGRLQPATRAADGSLVILSSTLEGLTRQAVWGGATAATEWMAKVKRQFDPKNLLNPGRFVYDNL